MNLTWSALLCAVLMSAMPVSQAYAQTITPYQSREARELEDRLRSADDPAKPVASPVSSEKWRDTADRLGAIAAAPELKSDCPDASYVVLGAKYAVGYDAGGAACKLYDLSFPTLKAFGKTLVVSALPTQTYTAKDYLEWINGNENEIAAKVQAFQAAPSFGLNATGSEQSEQAEWMLSLKFKDDASLGFTTTSPAFGARPGPNRTPNQMPKSFRASDLDVGRRFSFSARDQERLKTLIAVLKYTGTPDATIDVWSETVMRPESFLEKIRFDYNEVKKAYDIALEADFLPLGGPVALIDFKAPYKPAVERLIRSVLGASLRGLARLIPHPTVQNVVDVAIGDTFEFVEMAYAYQYNQLEDTLRATQEGRVKTTFKPAELQSMLDLAFGVRSDFMSQYVMARAQGQKFDWSQIEKIGKRARYGIEKTRDVTMSETNSRLVLKKNCEMQITNRHFGTCSRKGQKVAMYSLMSTNSLLVWNLGAPLVYKFNSPAEVPLKRGVAYLLSVGVRVANVGIGKRFSQTLSDVLKGFAWGGAIDEAVLKNQLWLEKTRAGGLDTEPQKILSALYVQNLNPFLAHSEKTEAKFIQVNARALKTVETAPAEAGLE